MKKLLTLFFLLTIVTSITITPSYVETKVGNKEILDIEVDSATRLSVEGEYASLSKTFTYSDAKVIFQPKEEGLFSVKVSTDYGDEAVVIFKVGSFTNNTYIEQDIILQQKEIDELKEEIKFFSKWDGDKSTADIQRLVDSSEESLLKSYEAYNSSKYIEAKYYLSGSKESLESAKTLYSAVEGTNSSFPKMAIAFLLILSTALLIFSLRKTFPENDLSKIVKHKKNSNHHTPHPQEIPAPGKVDPAALKLLSSRK